MNKELISVIVPIYNTEIYLKRCLDSLINQTYKNLEIILVDDGSTDNSFKICHEYQKKDKRIKVYHKENGGLSSTRNYGIKKAHGNYIAFLDSDDYINRYMYEKLFKYLKNTNSDIAIASIIKFSDDQEIKTTKQEKIKLEILEGLDKFKYLEEKIVETVLASNKLYKKVLFKEINYPNLKLHEDAFIIHHLLDLSKRIVYTNEILFYYFQRDNSITKKYNLQRLDEVYALKDRLNFFKQDKFKDTNYFQLTYISYVGYLIKHYWLLNYYKQDKKYIKLIKSEFNHNYKNIKKYNSKAKLKYFLVRYLPKLYLSLKYLEVKVKHENQVFD